MMTENARPNGAGANSAGPAAGPNGAAENHGGSGAGPASALPEQMLPQVPSLAGVYANAAARSARLMVGKPQTATTLPHVAYRVDQVRADDDQLARYQHLLGDVLTDALPAGYVHVLAFPVAMAVMAREDFPLPLLGMVHIANQVQVRRPIDFQERLSVRAWAQELRRHAKGTQVELVVEVTGSGAEEVAWRGVSTYLAKGRTVPGIPEAVETPRAGEAWPEGLPEPSAQWRLGAGTGRAYADVSGDRNPIHLGALPAKAFGFPRAIAHGMYTAARALTEVTVDRPEAFTWQVDFGKPVLLPGTVSFAAREVPGPDSGSAVPAGTGTPEAPTGTERPAGPATSPAPAAGGSTEFIGWHPRSQKVHFSGRVDRHA